MSGECLDEREDPTDGLGSMSDAQTADKDPGEESLSGGDGEQRAAATSSHTANTLECKPEERVVALQESSEEDVVKLFWASRHGCTTRVRALVASGASLDWQHPTDGRTPLSVAVCHGQLEAARELISGGASIDIKDVPTGHTPLTTAVIEGQAPHHLLSPFFLLCHGLLTPILADPQHQLQAVCSTACMVLARDDIGVCHRWGRYIA
jgi:hypothetical protein